MSLEYKNRLQTILGQEVNISPQDLFDYPNITDLSKYLLKQLGKGDLDATAEVTSNEIKENEVQLMEFMNRIISLKTYRLKYVLKCERLSAREYQ